MARRRLDMKTIRRLSLPAATEKFCQALFENGGDPVAAVKLAFPRYASGTRHTVLRRARLLMSQPEVQAKLQERANALAEVQGLDREWLLNRAKQVATKEPPEGQQYSSATMKALEFIGFVTGHYRPKQDVNHTHTITVTEEKELMHRLRVLTEQAQRLGIPAEQMLIEGKAVEVEA
jgi:hypothetical protein